MSEDNDYASSLMPRLSIVIELINVLDVQIFRPVKTSLRALSHRWTSENPGKTLTKFSMIREVARPAFEAALSRTETIRKGFQVTGIYPFNPSAGNRDKLKAGNIFQSSSTSTSTQSKTVVADPVFLDDSDGLQQTLQLGSDDVVQHVPHGLAPGGQSTTGTPELLAEIVTSSAQEIPPLYSVLLASAPINSPADTVAPTEGNLPEFTTLKAETLEERIQKLKRFEIVLLTPTQIGEFERNFQAGARFEFSNYLWKSWLQIKLATIGSEKEAFDDFLQSKIPQNIPKRITTRKVNQPVGPDRIDPNSASYIEIFKKRQEDENLKEEKKKETAQKKLEREVVKKIKKEKASEKEKAKEPVKKRDEKEEAKEPVKRRAEKEKATEPVKKRGRPRKVAEDTPPEESLAEIFSKLRKKRKS